ncbi:UNVERIFIED_CONTAM: hypothetical protein RMT77_003629 [Armadillidium vulgare]
MKILLIIVCFLPSIVLSYFPVVVDNPEPRFGNVFGSIFNKFHVQTAPAEPVTQKPKLCVNPESYFLEGKCLLLQITPANKDDAVAACTGMTNGKLYAHNIENPFLYEYIFKFYPRYFDANQERVWTEFVRVEDPVGSATFKIQNAAGNDVTNNPYFAELDITTAAATENCIVFDHSTGALIPDLVDCTTTSSYVCEFPSLDNTYVQNLW